MKPRANHFVRDALTIAFGYTALVAAAWIALGLGGAVIAAIGAGALLGMLAPIVFIQYEELQPRWPRR